MTGLIGPTSDRAKKPTTNGGWGLIRLMSQQKQVVTCAGRTSGSGRTREQQR
jgi:hypothetical protein